MYRMVWISILFLVGQWGLFPGSAAAQTALWPEITQTARPWTRWWWPGSAVDSANLSWQLAELAKAGFGGVEVTSIYGAKGAEARFIPYLSPQWNQLLLYAADEARRLGMGLDMPPGSGWRTGGPFVTAPFANASLKIDKKLLKTSERWTEDFRNRRIHAIRAYSAKGEMRDLLPQVQPDSSFSWKAPRGTWTVYVAEVKGSGEKIKRPAPGGEGLSIDVYSAAASRWFFEEYQKRIPQIPQGAVRAWFHDSFEYTGDGSDELFAAFLRYRGYDLRDHLPALAGAGDPDQALRVQADYRETLAEMLRDHFITLMSAWSHAQGGLSRNQAHGSPGNMLDLYAACDIPETETFGPLAGADADVLVNKFASSAAHVTGKPLVSSETATWLGEHFTVSLDSIRAACDQVFVAGVNHLFFHGTVYSPRDAAWPGWLFYASVQLNPQNPLWRDLPALNQYIARCQALLQSGKPDADILLYWPYHDVIHSPGPLRMQLAVHNPRWFRDAPAGHLADALWKAGYQFDLISDRQLMQAQLAADGQTIETPGARYRVIVVPACSYMPPETLAQLRALAEGGAIVIFQENMPADAPGWGNLTEKRERLNAEKNRLRLLADREIKAKTPNPVQVRRDVLRALGEFPAVRREAMMDIEGVQFIRRRREGGFDYFLSYRGDQPLNQWVALGVPATAVLIGDAMSGESGLAQIRTGVGGNAECFLQIEPGESRLLRSFSSQPPVVQAWPYRRPAGEEIPLRGPWQVDFLTGGPEIPQSIEIDSLHSWTEWADPECQRFAGTARYSLRFDDPGTAETYWLDLGRVAASARIRLNGNDLQSLVARPFALRISGLREKGNLLEIEVTNLPANRIRDLDRRGVEWRYFYDINFVNIDYQPFDASGWPLHPSGLLGPVRLFPLK